MCRSITVTFIRHAQSADNLLDIWARKDTSLSSEGMDQARALAESLADTHFTTIYASDLKCAFTTAQALHKQQKDPKRTHISSELLREQDFGVAEGKPISNRRRRDRFHTLESEMKYGVYAMLQGVDEKYPGGESLLDLLERSKKAVTQLVLPHLWKAVKERSTGTHIAVVGHGRCLQAIMYELLLMSSNHTVPRNVESYSNLYACVQLYSTAWTRIVISIEDNQSIDVDQHPPMVVHMATVNHYSHLETNEYQTNLRRRITKLLMEKTTRTHVISNRPEHGVR